MEDMKLFSSKEEALKEYFGYTSFRSGQEEIVNSLLSGRDTLGVMPTGAGKSICYQIPAVMMRGITIVISPLISLMQDQVSTLLESGIKAAYINSSLSMEQLYTTLKNASLGVYKLIYVAPERLENELFVNFAVNADISMITVDEAHCISRWGQDFRPSYLNIPVFAEKLPRRPIMSAFTATATERVRQDIERMLGLSEPFTLVTGFDRRNLYFEVRRPADRTSELMRLIRKYSSEDRSGIVYCSTRKNVESICDKLRREGFSASRYHAGLPDAEKHTNQEDFIYDRVKVMVATNAFGMGIDKSNVTFVIHYNMPKDIESYYQEAGRAGRDGSPSDCILLYSESDFFTGKYLINKSFEESHLEPEAAAEVRSRDLKRLYDMARYCRLDKCLRKYILNYFGEAAPDDCEGCSNCCSQAENSDITTEAQKIMSCIFRAGQKYGSGMICDVLMGKSTERINQNGLDALSTYGIMKGEPKRKLMFIIDRLEMMGYIMKEGEEFPVLKLCPSALGVLKGQVRVMTRLPSAAETGKKLSPADKTADAALMEKLRSLRQKLASTQGVPAYVIFSDSTLRSMCEMQPVTDKEFLDVPGVGILKLERYGDSFMEVIANHTKRSREEALAKVSGADISERKGTKERASTKRARIGFNELLSRLSTELCADTDLTVTEFSERIIKQTAANISCSQLRKAITGWLVCEGYLSEDKDSRGYSFKNTTESSESIGIYSKKLRSPTTGMEYIRVRYTPKAQRFIIERLNEMAEKYLSQI